MSVAAVPIEADYRELLLGCGHSRVKKINPWAAWLGGTDEALVHATWAHLETLDVDRAVPCDWRINLNAHKWFDHTRSVALPSDAYDEVHAYEVLEHLGGQGDVDSFFAHFGELYRILKPGGFLVATVPSVRSEWLWGDPGHRRAITRGSLVFLDQSEYRTQIGHTPMTDYRAVWKGDFEPIAQSDDGQVFAFVLRARKPAGIPSPPPPGA